MDENRVSALGALYQGEKSDASSIFNVAMTMMGIAAAYVVGAISLADKYGSSSLPWSLVVLLPAPLWIITVFHSLIVLNSMHRGLSVSIIEDRLCDIAGFTKEQRDNIGTAAGDRVMDITRAKWPHKIATGFVYAGVGLLVVGYTVYVLIGWWHSEGGWPRVLMVALYVVCVGVAASSWTKGLIQIDQAKNEVSPDIAVLLTAPTVGRTKHDRRARRAWSRRH